MRWMMAIGLLATALFTSSCGDAPGDLVVIKRQEPDTLLRQGTAITEEESRRREEEEREGQREKEEERRLYKLENALSAATGTPAKVAALRGLGELGARAESLLGEVDALLEDPAAEVRLAALEARALIKSEGFTHLIRERLKDESAEVRKIAIELWAQHAPEDLGLLVSGLADDDIGVQYAAVTALKGAASLPPALLGDIAAGLEDMSGTVAKAAFDLLLERADRFDSFAGAVRGILEHRDMTVRLLAIEKTSAAGRFDKSYASKVVQTVMEDPEAAVRSAAYRWLKQRAPAGFPELDPEADYTERLGAHEGFQAWLEGL